MMILDMILLLALELDKVLLYEMDNNQWKKQLEKQSKKNVNMTESTWSKGKQKGSSLEGDKELLQRYVAILQYVDDNGLQNIPWTQTCKEANQINWKKGNGLLFSSDGANFMKYAAFRNGNVRKRFTLWLQQTENSQSKKTMEVD